MCGLKLGSWLKWRLVLVIELDSIICFFYVVCGIVLFIVVGSWIVMISLLLVVLVSVMLF